MLATLIQDNVMSKAQLFVMLRELRLTTRSALLSQKWQLIGMN